MNIDAEIDLAKVIRDMLVASLFAFIIGYCLAQRHMKTEAIKNNVAVYRVVDQEKGTIKFTWLNPTNTP